MLPMSQASRELYVMRLEGVLSATETQTGRKPTIDTFPIRKCDAERLVKDRSVLLDNIMDSGIEPSLPYWPCGPGKVVKVG